MSLLRGSTPRSLTLTVSTTNCVNIREDQYKARLELVYDYLVEYSADDHIDNESPDIIGVGNAIAFGVATALDECSVDGSPEYSVELVSPHEVFEDGFCQPVNPDNVCKVIRGFTRIRLDNNVTNVEEISYDAIDAVLGEPLFIGQFVSMPFARTEFIRVISNSVLQLTDDGPSNSGPSISIVVIAASCVAILLAIIFLAGVVYKRRRNNTRDLKQQWLKEMELPGSKTRCFLGAAPRNYFELGEEQEAGSVFKVLNVEPFIESPTHTWSLSDITSENGSIMSSLSRATSSKLARIEEADDEGPVDVDEEWDGSDTYDYNAIPPEHLYDVGATPRHHVDQWDVDVDVLDEVTEPEGCRYLEDSSVYNDGYQVDSSDDDSEEPHLKDCDVDSNDYLLASVLDTSADTVETSNETRVVDETRATSNETRAVLHSSARDFDQVDDEDVQKWVVALLKELHKTQRLKLLTNYPQE